MEGLTCLSNYKGYDLPVQLIITALKNLMVGRAKDSYEDWVDSKVNCESRKEWSDFGDKVQSKGGHCEIEVYQGQGHGFFNQAGYLEKTNQRVLQFLAAL